MKFSVVLVNYADSWSLIAHCLESLADAAANAKDAGFEAIVVDNDDASRESPELPSAVEVIRSGRNLGFARAANRGVSASSGSFIVLINPDSTVEPGFFEKVGSFFESDPSAGIAGPRILDTDGALQLSARREVSFASGLFGRTSLLTKLFPDSSLVKSQFPTVVGTTRPTAVDWVSGACMVVRREVLEEVGPLDERFFMYFEDADLCRRAREGGHRVYYLPHVEVVHHAGGSTHDRPRSIWRLHKSAFLYHRKHGARGPMDLYSLLVLLGLSGRALARLAASYIEGKKAG